MDERIPYQISHLQCLGEFSCQKENKRAFMAINFKIFKLSSSSASEALTFIPTVVSRLFKFLYVYLKLFLCEQISWCKFEVFVECSKDIHVARSSKNAAEIPHAVVTAINLKTIINEKQNVNEVISASVICCHKAKVYFWELVSYYHLNRKLGLYYLAIAAFGHCVICILLCKTYAFIVVLYK